MARRPVEQQQLLERPHERLGRRQHLMSRPAATAHADEPMSAAATSPASEGRRSASVGLAANRSRRRAAAWRQEEPVLGDQQRDDRADDLSSRLP